MIKPARCHCGSSSYVFDLSDKRYRCCSCHHQLWQLIETAPKTGVTILVYGYWPDFPDIPDVAFAYWDEDDQWWAFDGDEMNVTHWMFLPEPPRHD